MSSRPLPSPSPQRRRERAQTFAELWNGVDAVSALSEQSLQLTHELAGLLRMRAGLASAHADGLDKLIKSAHKKPGIKSYLSGAGIGGPPSSVTSPVAAVGGLIGLWEAESKAARETAAAIEGGPVNQLVELEAVLESNSKKCSSELRVLTKEKKEQLNALGKSRMAFLKAAKEAEIAEKTLAARKDDAGARQKELDKLTRKAEKAKEDASGKHATYSGNVSATNAYLEGFYTARLPLLLERYEADFETRARTLKQVLVTMGELECNLHSDGIVFTDRFRDVAANVDPEEERTAFLAVNTPDTVSFKPYEVIEHQEGSQSARKRRLPRLPNISKSSSSSSSAVVHAPPPPTNPKFGVPLSELASPAEPVPKVLTRMLDLVRAAGAMSTEGVFRKPGSKTVVDAMREALEYERELPDNPDIHDVASLLKEWFRSLPEAAIPPSAYNAAVGAGENCDADPRAALDVLASLDVYHQASLRALFDLLVDMCSPDVMDITLMTPTNLGVCFGPTLLRNPALDPLAAMANIDAEVAFVRTCIQQLLLDANAASGDGNVRSTRALSNAEVSATIATLQAVAEFSSSDGDDDDRYLSGV